MSKKMRISSTQALPDAVIASAMSQALEAALAFEGATAPNPPVGCALLDCSGALLALAAHQKAGYLHAEALAIQQARGSGIAHRIHTVVVTLEPCNHHGRTPPCTDAILATPASTVVIGRSDPNPAVQGGGAQRLAAAGLSVSFVEAGRHPALALSLKRLLGPFSKRVTSGLPWVTVKQAINREGTMLPRPGHKTFTSQGSLILAHRLRRRADAIITGSGTILADAPEFTVRHIADFAGKRRKLVLFDRRRRVSNDYLTAAAERGFEVISATELAPTLQALADQGALEVLVEAGPQFTQAVLSSPYWDELVRITQTAAQGGEDHVEITPNNGTRKPWAVEKKHVLRHH